MSMEPPPLPSNDAFNQPPPLIVRGFGNGLAEIDDKKLKNLYSDHRSIQALSILWMITAGIFLLAGIVVALAPQRENEPAGGHIIGAVIIGISALYLVTAIGILKRRGWTRTVGMVMCVLSLPGFPVGTLIGIFGLIAFTRSPELFGDNRLDPSAIKAEYQLRKQAKRF